MSLPRHLLTVCLLCSCSLLLHGQAVKASLVVSRTGTAPSSLPARVIAAARSYLGVPYVTAGDSQQGMDCSGLVFRVFSDTVGADLSRGVQGLYRQTAPASYPLHIGDLVFFDTTERPPLSTPTHVGIYIGNGQIVHAASEGSRTGVIVSALNDPYYRDRLIGVRRVLPWRAPVLSVTLEDEKTVTREAEPFPSHETVAIEVTNAMSGGGPVELTLLKDGKALISRWITAGAAAPARLTFESEIGTWSVRITRIFKGRTLADVSFGVVE